MSAGAIPSPETAGLNWHRLPVGAAFWSEFAALVLARDPQARSIVVLPSDIYAPILRTHLARAAVNRGIALRVPRLVTLSELARASLPPDAAARNESERRIELFGALKAAAWLEAHRQSGSRPFWAIARQLTRLCDQLTLGLGDASAPGAPPIETRLLAVARGSYRARAWEACSAEAQLVVDVWRATLSHSDGAARLLRGLEAAAQAAAVPLVVVQAARWEAHERAFLEHYAQRQNVLCVERDLARALQEHPSLAAAWPELSAIPSEPIVPLVQRASKLRQQGAPLTHVVLAPCNSLEEQATRAARTVLAWRAEGCERIGVVALDRIVARRLRALLERGAILVRDESGWRFSTTAVAGTLMRWIELTSRDAARCDSEVLLDWLKSPHTFADVADKAALLACIERAVRRRGILRGLDAITQALALEDAGADPGRADGDLAARAQQLIDAVRQAIVGRPGRAALAQHFAWLQRSLAVTGMAAAFAADAGGAALLELLRDQADDAAAGAAAERFTFDEWRDFLGDALENATFRDNSIASPIAIVDFSTAALRDFEAVLILGADAEHFPLRDATALFLAPSLEAQLGLVDRASRLRDQLAEMALLLAAVPRVLITWQAQLQGERRAPAAALERLSLVHRAAFGDSLRAGWSWPVVREVLRPVTLPQATAPQLVPDRVTASEYASLVRCPYQYFAHTLLGLRALDDLTEEVSQRDYGEVVHRILERFHATGDEGTREALEARLAHVGDAVFNEMVGDNPRFLGFRERWRSVRDSYIEWLIEWRAGGAQFIAAEERASAILPLASGAELRLVGRLDRVERVTDGLAIIDYKARSPQVLRAQLALPGEDVQLPFYRLLRPDAAAVSAFYLSVDRNEVKRVAAPQPIEALADALAARIGADFSRMALGAALPALGVETVCQYCDARGLCRKGQWSMQAVRESVGS